MLLDVLQPCTVTALLPAGTDAAAKISMNPKNTPHQLKRLLGKKFSDPAVQADIARLPFKVSEGPDGGCLVHVTFCNEPAAFTPEQLMAMVLTDLKKIAEGETGIAVTDCAISVPTFFTEAERYAMLNAASVAGLNCLRLVNETTATALAYGIFKTDLPDTDPVHVGFVDVGHSSTQVRRSLMDALAGQAACLQGGTAAALAAAG
jgi:heat shock protein 4